MSEFGIDTANMFGFWDWVGGRYSMDSAIGLSTMLAIGPDNFRAMLDGFHQMDEHFRTAPFERNLPVLMGLLSRLVQRLLRRPDRGGAAVRAVPEAIPGLSAAADDGEQRQARHARRESRSTYPTGPIYWGEPGTNGQHSFYQLIHQGTRLIPCDFIAFARSRSTRSAGTTTCCWRTSSPRPRRWPSARRREQVKAEGTPDWLVPHRVFEGNRPSNTILAERLTPETLGKLVALYEHSVFTQGAIWNIDSFDQWGVELGKVLAQRIIPELESQTEPDARPRQLDEQPDPPLPKAQGARMTGMAAFTGVIDAAWNDRTRRHHIDRDQGRDRPVLRFPGAGGDAFAGPAAGTDHPDPARRQAGRSAKPPFVGGGREGAPNGSCRS